MRKFLSDQVKSYIYRSQLVQKRAIKDVELPLLISIELSKCDEYVEFLVKFKYIYLYIYSNKNIAQC